MTTLHDTHGGSTSFELYGARLSHFTTKLRAYLRFKGIDFAEAMSPEIMAAIEARVGFFIIPVLVDPEGRWLQDTTDVIPALEERFPEPPAIPATPRQRLVALLFEVYAAEWMLLSSMHYRWSFEENHAFLEKQLAELVAGDRASAEERSAAARGLMDRMMSHLAPLGITERTIPAIEADYERLLLPTLDAHFQQHPFLLGTRPTLADFALAGPMVAHLSYDPRSLRLMRRLAPEVVGWCHRVHHPEPGGGETLPDDEVPASLDPIFRQMFGEHWAVLEDCVRHIAAWLEAHPGEPLPRTVGSHTYRVGGVEETQAVRPYTQYLVQKVLDFYGSLSDRDRDGVDAWLRPIGGAVLDRIELRHRLGKDGYELIRCEEEAS